MEKISIIVPCYNVEKQIDRCVNSIVNQTIGLEALEIILVNDASSDRTYSKLCEWEKKFPENIVVINCKENMRQGGARNIGLSYASGDYIGFVDSDDWIDAEMYETLYRAIKEYTCEVANILFQRETEDGRIYQDETKEYIFNQRLTVKTKEDRKNYFGKGMPGGVYTKLYRKDFIDRNHLFFPEHLFYEDNFWGCLLSYSVTSYVIINKPLYHYMINLDSTTTGNSARHLDRLKIDLMKIEELKKRGFWEDFHDEIERNFLKSFWCMMLKRLFLQFPVFPYDILEVMRETVKKYFPDYLNNPYISGFDETEKMFLRLIELEIEPEQMAQYAEMYRKAFIKDMSERFQ